MNGHNTQTIAGFLTSLSHLRKKQLAQILMGEGDVIEAAKEAGFNDILIKEMSRDIRKNVQGMERFRPEKPFAEVSEATPIVETQNEPNVSNENQTPTESTDQIDPNPTVENQVPTDQIDQVPVAPAEGEIIPESTPDTTIPQS